MAAVKHSTLTSSYGKLWNHDLHGDNFAFDFPGEHNENEPELNLKENNNFYEVEIGVPGLGNKDFYIKVENGTLTISAEKNKDPHDKDYGTLKLSIAKPAAELTDDN